MTPPDRQHGRAAHWILQAAKAVDCFVQKQGLRISFHLCHIRYVDLKTV